MSCQRLLATTSICFDISIFEIFLPLITGGTVILSEGPMFLLGLDKAENITLVEYSALNVEQLVRLKHLPKGVKTGKF